MDIIRTLQQAKLGLITAVVVNIGLEEVSDLEASAIAAALRDDVHLRSLKIECGTISCANLRVILNALINNTTLTSIDFSILDISLLGSTAITQALQLNRTLKSVRLWNRTMSDSYLEPIVKYLLVNNSLETLYLFSHYGGWSMEGGNHLVRALEVNTSLRTFCSFYGNYGSKLDVQFIANLLKSKTALQSLSFHKVSIYGTQEAKIIATALKKNTTLLSIRFDGIFRHQDVAPIFADALGENTSLRAVSLIDSGMGDAGLQALAQQLRTNTSITELVLSKNRFEMTGIEALCAALHDNKTLKTLDLSSVLIREPASVNAINIMLQKNNSLRSLNLAFCRIYAGIALLAEGLRANTSLKFIDLSWNVEDEDIEPIASVLRVNRTLTTLRLCFNSITAQNIGVLVEALQENQVLTTLDLPTYYGEGEEDSGMQLVRLSLNQKLEQNRRRAQFITSPHGLINVVLYSLFAKPRAVPAASLPYVVKSRLTECATALKILDKHILGRAILAGYCVEPRRNPSTLPLPYPLYLNHT
jgi:Leucine Rich repeat